MSTHPAPGVMVIDNQGEAFARAVFGRFLRQATICQDLDNAVEHMHIFDDDSKTFGIRLGGETRLQVSREFVLTLAAKKRELLTLCELVLRAEPRSRPSSATYSPRSETTGKAPSPSSSSIPSCFHEQSTLSPSASPPPLTTVASPVVVLPPPAALEAMQPMPTLPSPPLATAAAVQTAATVELSSATAMNDTDVAVATVPVGSGGLGVDLPISRAEGGAEVSVPDVVAKRERSVRSVTPKRGTAVAEALPYPSAAPEYDSPPAQPAPAPAPKLNATYDAAPTSGPSPAPPSPRPSYPPAAPSAAAANGPGPGPMLARQVGESPGSKTLFVRKIDMKLKREELVKHFSTFGEVVDVSTSPARGFAFVDYRSHDCVLRAVSSGNHTVGHKTLVVEVKKELAKDAAPRHRCR